MKGWVIVAILAVAKGFAAEIPKTPIPPSPYLPIIYKFADAMLERGRNTNGLFYSALDRITLAPLTNRPPAPAGVRDEDRALTAANPQHDQNFLRLLYTLSELSGKPKYRDAADAQLRWFVENAHSSGAFRFVGPWMLWDRCFEIAPEATRRFALGLSNPQLDSKNVEEFYRQAGFYIRSWALAYVHTKHDPFLNVIDTLQARVESIRESGNTAAPSTFSLVMDCDAASRLLPTARAFRLRAFTLREDEKLPLVDWLVVTGGGRRVPAWAERYGDHTTAQIGMMCVSRYENTGTVGYRDVVHFAADLYLESLPAADADAWPITFGHAISLQVAAWRSTANQVYLDRARALADFAVKHFFDQGPLPRASLKSNHYEAITGADTLALGLVELHLHILAITAVRYPPNTIDR
jgi:hypothetical protein